MCILFCILNENAKGNEYKLILAANRDEFYNRPARVARRWEEDETIIGGRDVSSDGTWLAIRVKNNTFKFGALLNVTGEIRNNNTTSRGEIVVDYLKGIVTNDIYCQHLSKCLKKYNAFNLVTIEVSDNDMRLVHYSNVNNSWKLWPKNQVLGFSNSLTHQPYEKVKAGKEKFQKIINNKNQTKDELVQKLMKLLSNRSKHWPDAELQRRAPDWGQGLCSICVKMPEVEYGTRTNTVILIDANNKVEFFERTMASTDPNDEWTTTHLQTEFEQIHKL